MAYKNDLQKYYVGFYGRPADPAGLTYWNNVLEDLDVDEEMGFAERFALIQEYFAGTAEGGEQAEFDLVVGERTNEELVDMIYWNLFGRGEGEEDGRDFWVEKLDNEESTLITIVNDIIGGIEEGSADEDIFNNRLELANYFTNNLGTKQYGRDDIEDAQGLLFMVTEDPDTLVSAKASADQWIEDQVDDPDPPEPPVEPGEVIPLTVDADTLTGTANNDTFMARLGVVNGFDANTLNSADYLDGAGGDENKLMAYLIQQGSLTGGLRPIEPYTKNVQDLFFNARETDLKAGVANVITVGAREMYDVEYIESYYSDADLTVRGLTTNQSKGGTTPLPEMTVAMNHTSGVTEGTGSVIGGDWDFGPWNSLTDMVNDIIVNLPDYVHELAEMFEGFQHPEFYEKLGPAYRYINGQFDPASMKVLFEQNYLVPDVDLGIVGITFRIMNQDAHDATVGLADGPLNLDGVYLFRMEFALNGVQYNLAPYIVEDPNGIGNEFQTEAELVEHIQNVALPALIADNPGVPALLDVEVSLGEIWRDDDRNRPGREIVLTAPAENTLEVRDVWLQVAQAEDPDEVLPPEYGSNRIERVGFIDPEATTELSIKIELEKVGRGWDGGGLVVGGDNYTKGFDIFNVFVRGDGDMPSSLAYLLSTPHNRLEEINIYTHEDDVEDPADLTIGNSNTPVYSILDVNYFDASAFLGTLELYYAVIITPGIYDYLLGSTGDTISMHVLGDALNTFSSGLTIDAGNGNNTVHVDYLNSNGSVGVNTDITTGSGNDVVVLSNMMTGSSTVVLTEGNGAPQVTVENGDAAIVRTGGGNDAIFLNGHAVYCDAETAKWETLNWIGTTAEEWFTSIGITNIPDWQGGLLNWAPAGNVYPVFNTMIRVNFAGIQSDWIEIPSTGYLTSKQDIIAALAAAIEGDVNLNHLLTVDTDAPGGGIVINAITGGDFGFDDLWVDVWGPNPSLDDYFMTNPPGGGYSLANAAANQFLYFPGTGDVMDIRARDLIDAWRAYYPQSDVSIDANNNVTWNSTSDANVGYFDNPGSMTAFLIAAQENAGTLENLINAGLNATGNLVQGAGGESGGVQYVNAGPGHDTIVLPHMGITTVIFEGNFDTTTIVADGNFPFGLNIFNLVLDFNAYLDQTAAGRASSVNPDLFDTANNVANGFCPIPVAAFTEYNGVEFIGDWDAIGGGQHNSVNYFNFSELWNSLENAYASLAARTAPGADTDLLGNRAAVPSDSFASFGVEELESALNIWLAGGDFGGTGEIRTPEDYFDFRAMVNLGMDGTTTGEEELVSVLGATFVILVGMDGEVVQNWANVGNDPTYPDPYVNWAVDSDWASGQMKVFTGEIARQADGADWIYYFDIIQEHGVINLANTDFDFDAAQGFMAPGVP